MLHFLSSSLLASLFRSGATKRRTILEKSKNRYAVLPALAHAASRRAQRRLLPRGTFLLSQRRRRRRRERVEERPEKQRNCSGGSSGGDDCSSVLAGARRPHPPGLRARLPGRPDLYMARIAEHDSRRRPFDAAAGEAALRQGGEYQEWELFSLSPSPIDGSSLAAHNTLLDLTT